MAPETEPHATQLIVYLSGDAAAQVEAVMGNVLDLLAERGYGAAAGEDLVHALVGVKAAPFPDLNDDEAISAFLSQHAMFAIPGETGSTGGETP